IVSAWSGDKTYFQIGVLRTHDNQKNELDFDFVAYTFIEKDGAPVLSRYLQFAQKKMTTVIFAEREPRYKNVEVQYNFSSEMEVINYFRNMVTSDREDMSGLNQFPEGMPPGLPLPMAVSMLRNMEKGNEILQNEYRFEFPYMETLTLTLIAPIRTKPSRF